MKNQWFDSSDSMQTAKEQASIFLIVSETMRCGNILLGGSRKVPCLMISRKKYSRWRIDHG